MDESWTHDTKGEKASHKRPHTVQLNFYEMSRISKSMETESRLAIAKDWG